MNGSEPLDPSLAGLNDCGCCVGIESETPATVNNRPGLNRIAYRVGTHQEFKESLLAALSELSDPALAPLEGLRTRDDCDFSIALLDAWAAVADVLTFYQERIANESYLRTATERFSILELARLIGYELRPGIAANTDLAFSLDETPGSPAKFALDPGIKVQSIPGPGETPQTFETIESIEARVEWNAMPARQSDPILPWRTDVSLWLKGASTHLKPGDILLLVGIEREQDPTSDNWDVRQVISVEPDHDRDLLHVTWQPGLGSTVPFHNPSANPRVYALRQRVSLFGANAPDWATLPASLRFGEWVNTSSTQSEFVAGIYANRQSSWVEAALAPNTPTIWLDSVQPAVAAGSWLVLSAPSYTELYGVTRVSEEAHADFNVSAKVTRIDISGENTNQFSPRHCGVFIQGEELELAEVPISEPVQGASIRLDVLAADLPPGRKISVIGKRAVVEAVGKAKPLPFVRSDGSVIRMLGRGERLYELGSKPAAGGLTQWHVLDLNFVEGFVTASAADVARIAAAKDDETIYEVAEVDTVSLDGDEFHTVLQLKQSLRNVYDRQSCRFCANVAAATHGETVPQEVLGAGDATQAFQTFTLRQPPLTYLRSEQFPGFASTLQLRVNNLLWHETPSLYGQGPQDRVFITGRDDDGKTNVEFGDGVTGARLPTGVDNVRAIYRKGLGLAGNVAAGQLTMLLTRPQGLKSALNPEPASGGDDPEPLDRARANAPLQVLTLGRVVSLEDYQDFARAYPGIAKALATWTWDGHARGIFLTLAGPDGAAIAPDGDVAQKLSGAIAAASEPFVRVQLESYRQATFKLAGGLTVNPDYDAKQVLAAVKSSLTDAFSFDARDFGQPVFMSEVIAVIQSMPGLVAVDLELLYRADAAAQWNDRLFADLPAGGTASATAAELLILDPAGADDLEVNP